MRNVRSADVDSNPMSGTREVNTGLTFEELAGTCFEAYRNASDGAGTQLPPWHEIGEGHQEGWARVVRELEPVIVEADGVSFLTLARHAHQAYGEAAGTFEDEPPAIKLCWVAVVRHLANMLDFEKEDDTPVAKHESYWRDWVRRQLDKDFKLAEAA